ncbi:PREDICTED: uncharacterized protein LOC109329222 [Lupinus angustifolius]|uniref:uncharacterized protein LOC109329222 n=1 Tax=Lupinus angustifolius TaxID=3871 RepID=UPI00092F7277|nr:PREDICTED: uncharacterized protein LOC109329222 [Lupinus angustifolius]
MKSRCRLENGARGWGGGMLTNNEVVVMGRKVVANSVGGVCNHAEMASSANSPNTTQVVNATTQFVRAKSDPTWDHCQLVQDVDGKKSIKCLYCSKCYKGGGIHRIKQHLAGEKGDVLPCLSVPFEVKHQLREHLNQVSGSRKRGTNQIRREEGSDEENAMQHEGNMVPPIPTKAKGKTNPLGFAPRTTPGAQPSIRMGFAGKDAIHRADMAVVRFFYDCCIPFNCSNSVYYQPMIDAIAAIGPGYKGPSYYAFRSNLLHAMKKEVELLVETFRNFWKETGCTIMADGWQDQRNRQLINFLVYSPKGITFVRSVDVSDVVKDARTLCNLFIELVEFVGVTNVVHLVTDNAANYKAAGGMLNEKFPSIYWSPCAAHCLNLILGDIGKMEHVSTLAKSASDITKYYRDKKANIFVEVVMNARFWNDCAIIVNIVAPLIHLLRIVDADDRPSLPYVYDGMRRARKTIKRINGGHNLDLVLQWAINKRRTLDPIDYESMENIEFWIVEEEEEETPLIDYDEIEKMLYYNLSNPILDLPKDDEGIVEERNITIDGKLNLDSFLQEDVDTYAQTTSLTDNVNLGSNENNDSWMN